MEILAVGPPAAFAGLGDAVGDGGRASIVRTASGAEALAILSARQVDLIVIDEMLQEMTGLDLARQVAFRNPMTAAALVSPLAPEAFHEATEGLGILAQLPLQPGRAEFRDLFEKMGRVMRMTEGIKGARS